MTTVHDDGTVWVDVTHADGTHGEVPAVQPRRTCPVAAVLRDMKLNKPEKYQRLLDEMADDMIERARQGLVTL